MSNITNYKVSNLCYDYSIRFENIIWLACEQDQPSGNLKEFISGLNDDDRKKWARRLKQKVADLREAVKDDAFALIAEWFRDAKLEGFMVQVDTPIPQAFIEGGGVTTSGFGHYTTTWIYAESLPSQEFMVEVIAWRKSVHDEYRKKLTKKKDA